MYPHERSLVQKHAKGPFALLGVNGNTDLAKLRPVLAKQGITWRSFWDGSKGKGTQGKIATRWNVRGWPTTYVLDANGRIRAKNVRAQKLEHAIDTLLAELAGNR